VGILQCSGRPGNAIDWAKISDLIDPSTGAFECAYGIDLALHDLAGRILGKPVYQLLSTKGPTHISIYTGAIYFAILSQKMRHAVS